MRPRQAPAPRAQGRRARSCCQSLCWSSCAVTGQQHTPPRVTTRALRPKRYPTPGPNRCLCQQAVNLVSLSGQSKPTPGRAPGLHGHGSVSQDVDLELKQVQSLECGQVVEEQKRDREPRRVSRWGSTTVQRGASTLREKGAAGCSQARVASHGLERNRLDGHFSRLRRRGHLFFLCAQICSLTCKGPNSQRCCLETFSSWFGAFCAT